MMSTALPARSCPETRRPNLVVIGAQKAASTFVQQALALHPEVYLPWGETPCFESPDYEHGGREQIESIFSGRSERVLGIKRPNYLGRPEVPARIVADLPEARLIAVLREPVSRLVSAYFEYMTGGFLPVLPVAEGTRRLLHDSAYRRNYPRAEELLEFGRYDHYLAMYRPFRDAGRLMVVLQEEVAKDGPCVLQRMFEYLDVDPAFVPDEAALTRRPKAAAYNLTRARVIHASARLQYRFNNDRTRTMGPHPNPLRRAAGKATLALDHLALSRVLPRTRPTLPSGLRHELQAFYAEDIRRLRGDWGLSVDRWLD